MYTNPARPEPSLGEAYALITQHSRPSHCDSDYIYKVAVCLFFSLNSITDSIILSDVFNNETQISIQYYQDQWAKPSCNITFMCMALLYKTNTLLPNSRCTQTLGYMNLICSLTTLSTPLWQHLSIMPHQDLLHFPMSIASLSLLSIAYQRTRLVNPYAFADKKKCIGRACFAALLLFIMIAECTSLYSATRNHPPHERIITDLISNLMSLMGTLALLRLGTPIERITNNRPSSTTP